MEATLIKCRFLDEDKQPKGREYTYATNETVDVGMIVSSDQGKLLIVTKTDVPDDVANGYSVKFVTTQMSIADDAAVSDGIVDISPNDDVIIIEQLPVITEHLAAISAKIEERIAFALALECTEETVKTIKAERATLNKELSALEEKRKQVKSAILSPYEQFEAVYKQFVSDKYKHADSQLKERIDGVEDELKRQKYDEVKRYFDEYRSKYFIDFVRFERAGLNVTLSASTKSLKEQAKAFIDRICDDLALIELQEYRAEILIEYQQSLSVSQAITTVTTRHRAVEELSRRQAETEARMAAEREAIKRVEAAVPEQLAPPTVEQTPQAFEPLPLIPGEPVKTLVFKVTAPISMLRELKKFLEDGGYTYE